MSSKPGSGNYCSDERLFPKVKVRQGNRTIRYCATGSLACHGARLLR